jgi:hypothetical protein
VASISLKNLTARLKPRPLRKKGICAGVLNIFCHSEFYAAALARCPCRIRDLENEGFSGAPATLLVNVRTHLPSKPRPRVGLDLLRACVGAIRLRACIAHEVALAIEAGDEHGAIVVIAPWLVGGEDRRLTPLGRHISEPLTEAARTEFGGATKKFNGVVRAERRDCRRHGPKVLVAQG